MTSAPKVYVAGHKGMVGSAIVRQLMAQGYELGLSHLMLGNKEFK